MSVMIVMALLIAAVGLAAPWGPWRGYGWGLSSRIGGILGFVIVLWMMGYL